MKKRSIISEEMQRTRQRSIADHDAEELQTDEDGDKQQCSLQTRRSLGEELGGDQGQAGHAAQQARQPPSEAARVDPGGKSLREGGTLEAIEPSINGHSNG